MQLDDYDNKDGKQVWLTIDEVDMLLQEAEDGEQKRAFQLAVRSGLRRSEVVSVTVNDVVNGPDGFLRVWEDYAKRDSYREPPIPDSLETVVCDQLQYTRDGSDPVVDVSGSTVYRWVQRAAERLQEKTGDSGWEYLDVHDLRRTWGGHMLWNCGVSSMVVREWGGWEDFETFEKHYMGQMTPEAMQRERGKIDYASNDDPDSIVFEPASTAARDVFTGATSRQG